MKKLSEYLLPVCIALVIASLCTWGYLQKPGFLEALELRAFDLRLKARGPQPASGQVVMVSVDEQSLEKVGRWPWSRDVTARLVQAIDKAEPRAVGYDIIFSEKQANPAGDELVRLIRNAGRLRISPTPQLQKYLKQRLKDTNSDYGLASSLAKAKSPQVLGYYLNFDPESQATAGAHTLDLAATYFEKQVDGRERPSQMGLPQGYKARTNLRMLAKAAGAQAYFNVIPDPDGTIRRYNLCMQYNGTLLQPLAAAMFAKAVPRVPPMLLVTNNGPVGVQWERHTIPTDAKGRMILNYRGPAGSIEHVAAWKLLKDNPDAEALEALKDKYVLVGVTAPTVYDLRVTPFGVAYPGLEIHATALDSMLLQDFIKRPEWAPLYDIAAIWFFALVTVGYLWRARTILTLAGVGILGFGFYELNMYFFAKRDIWLNMVYPMLCFLLTWLGLNTYRYLFSDRQKKQIRQAFSKYLDPGVVDQVTDDPERLALGGEKLNLTVLFSDIRSFTNISEQLDPEVLVGLLNEYLSGMTRIVMSNKGLLDKYVGDAVIAVYGAPYPYEDHPRMACDSALQMLAELEKLNAAFERRGLPELKIGIGLNTGEMIAGNMGSQERFDYTVIGDNVNLGARLEGLTKQYGVAILISEYTQRHIGEYFWTRSVDLVRVKGRNEPVEIFELLGRIEEPNPLEYVAEYLEMLAEYRKGEWDAALARAESLAERYPQDKVVDVYVSRLQNADQVPADWDGVCTFTTK